MRMSKLTFSCAMLLTFNANAADLGTFKWTNDFVHAIESKDDIRALEPTIFNKDDWFAALKRQPIKRGVEQKITYEMIVALNVRINHAYAMKSDLEIWNKEDYTATPNELMAKGAGDCEDFSAAKYYALAAMGAKPAQMNIYSGVYNANGYNGGHSVLVVELDNGDEYVLDVFTDKPIKAAAYMGKDFTPKHRLDNNFVTIY